MKNVSIINTQPRHCAAIYDVIRLAYDGSLDEDCPNCITAEAAAEQIERFPEGQFVAVTTVNGEELVVGMAATMRTNKPPTEPPLPWIEAIGSLGIANHVPQGDWLYGVEASVRQDYQGRGIGTALYDARFALVKRLNLRGWYAGGMLLGYLDYEDELSLADYGAKVQRREIVDPTVTMQLNRGFEAWGVIENYMDESEDDRHAMLIVWQNPDYRDS
jgi:ribosomal protein S18 acetylase RimI-like enzyme